MPTQQEEKTQYTLDEWIGIFQGDKRRDYLIEFIKAEGLDKNNKLLGNGDQALAIVSLTTREDPNLFIAISGFLKEFELLNLSSVVKELTVKEEQFQSVHISLGALTPQQSQAKKQEKIDSSKPIVSFITQSFSTDLEDNNEVDAETLLKDRSKSSDKGVQFADLESNALFKRKPKSKAPPKSTIKEENTDTNNATTNDTNSDNTNNQDTNNVKSGNDIESMIAAAVKMAEEVDKEEEDNEFKALEKQSDFPDIEQDLFSADTSISATFEELVECLGDCDVDVTVTESKLRDAKVLINFKLEAMSETIVRSKTVFNDSSYSKWTEFKSDFGTVSRKSKLVIDEAEDYAEGFLVDGTMATVAFNFKGLPNLHDKWKQLVTAIESNPVIENIIELLTKDENTKVQIVDKLETECVVSIDFTADE